MYDPRYDEPSYDETGEDEGLYDGANYDEAPYDESAYDEGLDDEDEGDNDDEPGDEDGPREFHFQSRSAGRSRLHHNNQDVLPKKKALVLGITGSVEPHDQRKKGATIGAHIDARDVRQVLIGDFSSLHLQTFIFDHL